MAIIGLVIQNIIFLCAKKMEATIMDSQSGSTGQQTVGSWNSI